MKGLAEAPGPARAVNERQTAKPGGQPALEMGVCVYCPRTDGGALIDGQVHLANGDQPLNASPL